jgi:hypothetical protein
MPVSTQNTAAVSGNGSHAAGEPRKVNPDSSNAAQWADTSGIASGAVAAKSNRATIRTHRCVLAGIILVSPSTIAKL